MKNVYLVTTDLHLALHKANRKDYFSEILKSMQDILEIQQRYQSKGYTTNLILLGDVFDSSISNASDALQLFELFRFFTQQFNKTYCVVGNHEITFMKDNPFWFLTSTVEDEYLLSLKKYIQPRGLQNSLIIPGTLTDGEVCMYFNHYATPIKLPTEGGIKIGLFHQNVGSNEICKMWGTFADVEEETCIQGYDYCFFGHMHLAKGRYYLNEEHSCICEWLGTIGRTKTTEVIDDDLDVNIPAILIEDGKLVKVEPNTIHLQSFSECVDLIKLEAYEKSRKLIEERQALTVNKYKGNSLYETLHGAFAGTAMQSILSLLDRPIQDTYGVYRTSLEAFLKKEE